MDGLGPPMEVGGACNGGLALHQCAASLGDNGIEVIDRTEVFVDKRLVDKRPQVLSGLQFCAVGRLVDRRDTVWKGEILRAVPAGIVELQHDPALAPGA